MLAKQWRSFNFDRAFRHAHRPAEELYRAVAGMFDLVNKASLDQVRIVVEVARVEDGARGNASLGQLAHGLILITHQGPRANDPSQFVAVLVSICLLTKDARCVNDILADMGLMSCRVSDSDGSDRTVYEMILDHNYAFGAVAGTIRESLKDGRISASERSEINAVVQNEIDALCDLRAELNEMVRGNWSRPCKHGSRSWRKPFQRAKTAAQ